MFSVVRCPPLSTWSGHDVNVTEYIFDTNVEYSCSTGYEFPDDVTTRASRCDVNGVWQPEVVECIGNMIMYMYILFGCLLFCILT